jgi:hypothetical protein
MTDLLEYIKKMQEMYGDDVITTADKINRPEPKKEVQEIEAINEFVKRNPKASGGQLVAPSVDGSRPGYGGTITQKKTFKKVNDYLKELIPKLNAEEKFYTKEEVSNMVEKKFNIKPRYQIIYYKGKPSEFKVNQFGIRSYPIMKTLDSSDKKIDKVLKNMLIEDKPLNDFFFKALQKRTDLRSSKVTYKLKNNQTYQVLKDQGLDSLLQRFNKKTDHGFLKKLSLSDQLTTALELEKGTPRFTGVEDIKGQSKKGGVYGRKGFTYSPKFRVMEFAKRNWNRNKGEGAVTFVDQKGKPIKWKFGLELPFNKVGFVYNGKTYRSIDLTPELMQKNFPEVYNNQLAINKLNTQVIDDPINKGKTITVGELVKRTQVNNYNWSPKLGSFDIMHGPKGVIEEPFTNLTFNTRDINQIEMGINKLVERNVLKNKDAVVINKLINNLAGSGDPDLIRQRAIKLSKQKVKGQPIDYQTVKNNFLKNLTDKKFGRVADVIVKASKEGGFGDIMQKYCIRKRAKKGGRIFLSTGSGCPAADQDPKGFLKSVSDNPQLAKFLKSGPGKKAMAMAARVSGNVLNPSTLIGGEVAYVLAEGLNNFSKGLPLDESFDRAFIFSDFGKFEKNLMNKAKELGYDDNQLNLLQQTININKLDNRQKKLEYGLDVEKQDPSGLTSDATMGFENRLVNTNKNLDDSIINYLNTLDKMGFDSRKAADQATGFIYLDNVFKKRTQDQMLETYDKRKRQVDPTSGTLGNILDPVLDLGAYTQPLKYAADVVNPFTKNVPLLSDRQREAKYLKEMDPRELFLYNKQRGFTLDDIAAGTSPQIRETMDYLGTDVTGQGFGQSLAGGGIAGLSGGIDQGPQRISLNPDSQGLRSLIKNGRKL